MFHSVSAVLCLCSSSNVKCLLLLLIMAQFEEYIVRVCEISYRGFQEVTNFHILGIITTTRLDIKS